ncbi:MAG: PilC/PilY family type IV pilus protein [Usitatibacter sp.]
MKKSFLRLTATAAAVSMCLYHPAIAEDIDLFTSPGGSQNNPNVVIMIDNSANWEANNQHWPGVKQGQAELRALRTVVGEVNDKMNLGLMLFTPGSGSNFDGGYVRYHVRQMTAANKSALQELIGPDTCVNGPNSLNTTPNCLFNNFSSPSEKVGTAKLDYSGGLFEVFKYFGGYTNPANAKTDIAGAPIDATHFGALRYAGNPETNSDPAAYTGGASKTGYNSPINADGSNSCAKNYLVFIGNGFPTKDSPGTLLTGVGGSTSQLGQPQFTLVTNNITTTLGTDAVCRTPAACATAAAANPAFAGQDTYACSGGTATPDVTLGTDATCESAAACATRAQTSFPGYTSYYCTGGTSTPPQTGTDNACETAAACQTRAATLFPGHTTYACTGGAQNAGTVSLGPDAVVESRTACASRAAAAFPGYTSYSCTGGTAGASVVTPVGNSGLFCEDSNQCKARVAAIFPGHDSLSCGAGVAGVVTVGTDTICENATQCRNGITFPTGSNLTTANCTGGVSCGTGGRLLNQTKQGTCSGVGAGVNRAVTATDTPYAGQTMQATGCTAAGRLTGQTITASDCSTGQTMRGTNTCTSNQIITGTKAVNTVTPTGGITIPAAGSNYSDEWAKYLYTTDVNSQAGQQNVSTYTIDVFKDAQDVNETALLISMAKYGGGRYFQATSEQAILNALREILVEIQSVNSVFAAASLPINATNRSQNENQVFIGMFRPDPRAKPRWYGNLKRFQVARFGADAKLADKDGNEAVSATTGFVQACATSYYSVDSGTYWGFSPQSAGTCTTTANNASSDAPDGGVVEKGAAAEVLRRGNNPAATAPFTVNRTMKTCASAPCTSLTPFDTTSVTQARTGAATPAENDKIVKFTKGLDVLDENANGNCDAVTCTEPRPSIHGDIAHSRPLPVNFAPGPRGVEVYYGSNDGAFHALRGSDGTELWSFVAPEHHGKLKRLVDNTPYVAYPNIDPLLPQARKDYFFDGSAGLYQNSDNSVVWIFPTMRRGGRMMYAFDISTTTPTLKWAKGCPNMSDDVNCTAAMSGIGQTWSVPNVAVTKGYSSGTAPMLVFGGGYDACEDTDSATTTCASPKGNKVYILDADTGVAIRAFDTDRSVAADVTLIDRDFDGKVDHIYVADTGGNLYRIDLVDPTTLAQRVPASWTITKIATTTASATRKFLFGPAALATRTAVYLTLGSGDRERPLISNYPYTTPVGNRFYMFIDTFAAGGPVNLDSASLADFTTSTDCNSELSSSQRGWFIDLNAGTGEQTVTSSVIFGGTVFFSTNRPIATSSNSCAANLGEARGYAVNLLNASGVIGSGSLCGGSRSGTFTGGGLPPSPVVGTVPVQVVGAAPGVTRPISVLIGGINLQTGSGSPIGAQQPPVPIKQIRSRVYWYPKTDK